MDGGLLTLLGQEDCFTIPICAAVSRLRLQRATQLSTPGLPLDRLSLWTTYMAPGPLCVGQAIAETQRGTTQESWSFRGVPSG